MKSNQYDIVIIGGGAAGLMAAARCVGSGADVLLVEKNRECGKKLLITGKGRCNITNISPWREFQTHIHPDKSFFKHSFGAFSNEDVVSFFNTIGVECKVERGQRVFPVSDRSVDVRDALVSYINDGGIKLACGYNVKGIAQKDDCFIIKAQGIAGERIEISSRTVIVATGGLSYPTTGSTGSGYDFAKGFGHTIVDTFPSLTALKPPQIDSRLEGLLLKNVRMDLWVNGSVVQSEFGEVQFTSGGIEGALGFRLSRKAVKGLINGQKVEVVIDLKPAVDVVDLQRRIGELEKEIKGGQLSKILPRLLPAQMVPSFMDTSQGLNLQNLAQRLKNWNFKIVDYVGYERCVVTAGGVSLGEISKKRMESQLVPGLFFAGEVLDLDADTGGYNLQVAFSTGALAAESALKSISLQN